MAQKEKSANGKPDTKSGGKKSKNSYSIAALCQVRIIIWKPFTNSSVEYLTFVLCLGSTTEEVIQNIKFIPSKDVHIVREGGHQEFKKG